MNEQAQNKGGVEWTPAQAITFLGCLSTCALAVLFAVLPWIVKGIRAYWTWVQSL